MAEGILGKTLAESQKQKTETNKNPKEQLRAEIIFQKCYICKAKFTGDNNHKFYTNLCKNKDTKKSNSNNPFQFNIKYPFKNERDKKIIDQFMIEIP